MNSKNQYESKLWKVLEKEKLADLSQFHRPRFFDEVPLYSRTGDVAFLSALGNDKANETLLRFAVKFLKAVISYEEHRTPYWAAITVWNFLDGDLVVPNIFVDPRVSWGEV